MISPPSDDPRSNSAATRWTHPLGLGDRVRMRRGICFVKSQKTFGWNFGFIRQVTNVANREKNGGLMPPIVAASGQSEVRSGPPDPSTQAWRCVWTKAAFAAAPAGVWGLLASHNGGSRGALYLSASGRLPGDKKAIYVYGREPTTPQPPTPNTTLPTTHVLVCNLL